MKKMPENSQPQYYEYLLLIEPDELIKREVTIIKNDFFEKYRAPAAKAGKPHITLSDFVMKAGHNENEIIKQLEAIAIDTNHIKILLNDFKSFGTHTIYINVSDITRTEALVNKISKKLRPLIPVLEDFVPVFSKQSHLTISRRLTAQQFEKASIEYEHKRFSGSFVAKKMLLLKRPIEGGKCELVKAFEFGRDMNEGTVVQKELFN
jgi:2'-5' RNA ligase